MPNPFPGMNPYLEDPLYWRSVHLRLINAIDNALNQILPDAFVAKMDERVSVEGWGQEYILDNVVVQTRPVSPNRGGVATLEPPSAKRSPSNRPLRLNFTPRRVRQAFVEIRAADAASELIAVIEVLSPTNKTAGPGREEYKRKQRDLLNSLVHLVEIDLLREGMYAVAPNEEGTRAHAGHFDYIVSLHRGATEEIFDVWPILLRDRLPEITIPLTEEADDITLDLQALVNQAYDSGAMDKAIYYDRSVNPPLKDDDAEWADALLREKGLR